MNSTQDTYPIEALDTSRAELLERVRTSGEPVALTVNGEEAVLLVDPKAFRELRAELEAATLSLAIQRGLEDVRAGRVRPAEEVFAELDAKYGFSR